MKRAACATCSVAQRVLLAADHHHRVAQLGVPRIVRRLAEVYAHLAVGDADRVGHQLHRVPVVGPPAPPRAEIVEVGVVVERAAAADEIAGARRRRRLFREEHHVVAKQAVGVLQLQEMQAARLWRRLQLHQQDFIGAGRQRATQRAAHRTADATPVDEYRRAGVYVPSTHLQRVRVGEKSDIHGRPLLRDWIQTLFVGAVVRTGVSRLGPQCRRWIIRRHVRACTPGQRQHHVAARRGADQSGAIERAQTVAFNVDAVVELQGDWLSCPVDDARAFSLQDHGTFLCACLQRIKDARGEGVVRAVAGSRSFAERNCRRTLCCLASPSARRSGCAAKSPNVAFRDVVGHAGQVQQVDDVGACLRQDRPAVVGTAPSRRVHAGAGRVGAHQKRHLVARAAGLRPGRAAGRIVEIAELEKNRAALAS